MTQITLEAIKAEHTRLAELIAHFEAQTAAEREHIHFPEALIDLNSGEHYAGLIVGKDGAPSYHLILLPGDAEKVTFEAAKKWAASIGGDLPTRREQALLYANLKEAFQEAWYWSGEAHVSEAGWAWCQYFGYGSQDSCHQCGQLRARAVRRLVVRSVE